MSDENKPAFPIPGWKDDEFFNGMTLRDYFAAHASENDISRALQNVADVDHVALGGPTLRVEKKRPDDARQIARYMHADAMIRVRGAS